MQRDQDFLSTENITQCDTINKLKDRIFSLESEVLQLQSKQTHELSYLGKRSEVESCGVFEIQEILPEKRKNDTYLLSQRIDKVMKNYDKSFEEYHIKRKSKK